MKPLITPEHVKILLDYNPETGDFVWKWRKLRPDFQRMDKIWNSRLAGKIVTKRRHRHGHLQIGIYNKNYMWHRVVWAHYYGIWPDRDIDHINGIPDDNRIINLRLATKSENLCNAKIRINNTTGVKGVSWSKQSKKWYAYINKNRKMHALGYFNCFGKAIVARKLAAKQMHGDFVRFT
jgi:hypothetical protein